MNRSQDTPLWLLQKDGRMATAVLRCLDELGYEARLLFDGSFRMGQVFRHDEQGDAAAKAWADEWRRDLESHGWHA